MNGSTAAVAWAAACEYTGNCERICPTRAISRPFQIVFISELTKGDR
jgi:ferredoxin